MIFLKTQFAPYSQMAAYPNPPYHTMNIFSFFETKWKRKIYQRKQKLESIRVQVNV